MALYQLTMVVIALCSRLSCSCKSFIGTMSVPEIQEHMLTFLCAITNTGPVAWTQNGTTMTNN
jgi:hypothetical protein